MREGEGREGYFFIVYFLFCLSDTVPVLLPCCVLFEACQTLPDLVNPNHVLCTPKLYTPLPVPPLFLVSGWSSRGSRPPQDGRRWCRRLARCPRIRPSSFSECTCAGHAAAAGATRSGYRVGGTAADTPSPSPTRCTGSAQTPAAPAATTAPAPASAGEVEARLQR